MEVRVLQNPFSKSFLLHLLLLLMFIAISLWMPKLKEGEDPISITVIDAKKRTPDVFDRDKERHVRENRSAKQTGGTTRIVDAPFIPNPGKSVHVKDLGVKIATDQIAPTEHRKNWAQEALGEEMSGGDYVEGLKEDETSALNTKEYIFYSYTERMRSQLYQIWAPIIRKEVERFYGMGFTFSENTQFVTRTRVLLNSKGEVIKVQLLQDSGVVDLDDAAITALNKAGPYPNPPRGLLNAKGDAELQWNFILRN